MIKYLFKQPPLSFRIPAADRGPVIGRWWIRHPYPEMFSSCLSFPSDSLIQRMIECDRPLLPCGTAFNTKAVIVAFIRIQYNRRFALFRIRHKDVHHTNFDTNVTAVTDFLIEYNRIVRCDDIRKHPYIFLCHLISPYPIVRNLLRSSLQDHHDNPRAVHRP